jgi:hypothetical protein
VRLQQSPTQLLLLLVLLVLLPLVVGADDVDAPAPVDGGVLHF